ncbi:MAG: galactose oxidase-like domain-containing protein [Terriglobales bacterium]
MLLILAAALPAWGAIAIDQTKSTDRSGASTTIASPSFSTTAANELLLAFISTDATSAGVTVTGVTGAGVTWALVRRTNTRSGTAEVWRAFASTTLTSVTVTATLSQSVAASMTVMTYTGTDTTGTSGSGAIGNTASGAAKGAPTASLVTTRAGSWVFGVGNDYDNATARTLGSNQTLVHQYLASVGDTYWVQRQTAATPSSGTTVTINDTAPTSDQYNLTIVEVLPAAVVGSVPDLTVSKTHAGNFIQGQTGGSYTITATNSGGAATSGTVTVTDTLPAGLTATAMSGTNWACTLATLTCTRNDALTAGTSYPAITVTVNVASNAPASVTNTATVSGGGETNTSNDTANDVTTITPVGVLTHVGGASAHPTPNNSVYSLNYTPVATNDALVVLIGCRDSTVTAMNLTASGWTLTPISALVGPSGAFDFIRSYGAITPNTTPVTFTVTLTGGGNCSGGDTTIMIDEFSGNDTTGGTTTFDAHNESLDNGVIGICTGAPVTPLNNNDAIWYACYDNVTGVTSGYTKGQDDSTGDWTEYKILSGGAGVAQNPGFTTNPSFTSFGLGGVSIKAASGSGPTTYTVTGSATPASLANGASVVLSQNTTTLATTTIASGSYTFPSVSNGTYTVTPSLTGVNFSPTSQSITVASGPVAVPAFTATAQTWQVSGSITPASLGSGSTLTLSQSGTTISTATAAGDGTYSFPSVANGTYTVTPTKTGVSFNPTSQSVTVASGPATVPAFTATAQTWQVSGSITPATLGSGATLTLSQSGTTISTATAAGDGTYSFPSVANGTYTLTPSKSGVNFNPTSQSLTVSNGPQTVPVFTASVPSGIALIQKATNGNEATGANISVSFPSNNTAGNFLIVTGTAARPAGTLTISDTAGDTFTPAMGPVTDTNQDVTAYIWYVPSCKGGSNTVTITPATAAALEIHVSEWTGLTTTSPVDQTASATGTGTAASSGAATTTANGELIFGYTFLFNTATAGSGFTPMSLVNGDLDEYQVQSLAGSIAATYTQTSGTWFVVMATFKPAGTVAATGSIAGNITPATGGMTVNLSGPANGATSTDGSGNYGFNGLPNGTYTVTPSASGYSFSPPSQSVPVSGSAVTGINFTATQVTTAALAIDVNVSKNNTSASTSIVSGSFSTKAANEVLLALVATDSISANMTVTGVTGGGLTWSLVERTNAQGGTSEIWKAFAPSVLSSASVTAHLSQSVLGSMTVLSFSGADPNGPIGATGTGSAATGAPTASLITTRNGSWVVGVGTDIARSASRTVPSNQTLIHQDRASGVNDTFWMQRQNAATPVSGTTVFINDTAPTNDSYNLSIAEVLPAITQTNGTPPAVVVIAPAAGGTAVSLTSLAANAMDSVGVAGVQFMIDGVNIGSEVTTAPYYMTWNSTTVSNGTHTLTARARNTSSLTSTSSITINVDNSGNPAVVGSWSSAVTIPTVAVNLLLLKNNKLMFYEDGATATIWDYVNNVFTSTPETADLFCSGHAFLADGRVLVVGGFNGGGNKIGIPNAEIFDPATNTWTAVPNMNFPRWYPTATTLSDGRIIVMAGWNTGNHDNVGIPEIYDPSTNSWTQLTAANNPFETYPFIYQLPDGRLLHLGGSEYATVTEALNLNTNAWTTIDSRIIDGASPAMYLPNKFVKAGSASDSQGGSAPVFNTAYVLDMMAASPAWQQVPSMVYPRSFMNMTELPDGTVLATGGETDRNGGTIANAVYAAELWSPTTQTWTTMAAMHTPREYHSTALLLPDGRVVQSGMGSDFGNVPDEKTAEFYSPPYLFKGARPTITQAPAQISYGANFSVSTPDAASITSVVLIRNGGVTHFFDENTRYLPLSFTQSSGGLTVTAPVDGRLAPPGYYMLFLVNSNGVPSVAPMLQVGP